MKRISRALLLTFFAMLLLGGTNAFAGNGNQNNQGNQNNKGNNNQGNNNQGNNGGGLIGWIEGLLDDIFGNNNSQGNNNQGNNNNGVTTTSGGGTTAPIDGGIGLLLVAGAGLGIKKAAARRKQA